MKKVIVFALVLMLCVSLACPVSADGFVPSITYKGEPEIVPVVGKEPAIAVVYEQEDEEIISYVYDGCLVITPVAEVDTSEEIPEAAAQELQMVYDALTAGTMELPYEKVEGYNGQEMVIRELFDASWLCGTEDSDHDHPAEVAPEGVVVDITFDLGVDLSDRVVVMTYIDDEWNPIVDVRNNGDGTVTCTFEELCPIAVSVVVDDNTPPPQTGDSANVGLWVGVMLAAMAAFVGVALLYRRETTGRKRK